MRVITALLIFTFSFAVDGFAKKLSKEQSRLISLYIREAAAKQNLEIALIRSVIAVESAFNHRAVSRAGAKGLMQIMPRTAESLGDLDALDPGNPRANILTGTRLLRKLINNYRGDLKLALAAYNAGKGAVEKYRGIPPYQETQEYVKKVLRRLKLERSRNYYGKS